MSLVDPNVSTSGTVEATIVDGDGNGVAWSVLVYYDTGRISLMGPFTEQGAAAVRLMEDERVNRKAAMIPTLLLWDLLEIESAKERR